eukprot:scaffold45810_cov32-Phaeocystis_antarctica.AAC.1
MTKRNPCGYTEWTVGRPVATLVAIACGGSEGAQQPEPHVHVRGHPFARSLFSPHLRDEQQASAARKVSASRAWVAQC